MLIAACTLSTRSHSTQTSSRFILPPPIISATTTTTTYYYFGAVPRIRCVSFQRRMKGVVDTFFLLVVPAGCGATPSSFFRSSIVFFSSFVCCCGIRECMQHNNIYIYIYLRFSPREHSYISTYSNTYIARRVHSSQHPPRPPPPAPLDIIRRPCPLSMVWCVSMSTRLRRAFYINDDASKNEPPRQERKVSKYSVFDNMRHTTYRTN